VPHFFDKANLTAIQEENWDRAMTVYSDLKQAATLRSSHPTLINLFWNGAGDEKSALFSRLLEGKDPLPEPPPCYYSYPWYGVVENKVPHPVAIGFYKSRLLIGQDGYTIVNANKAAKALTSFAKRHLYKTKGHSGWSRVQRRKIADILTRDPQWELSYNGYKFHVGYQQACHPSNGRRFCYSGKQQFRAGFSGGNPQIQKIVTHGAAQYDKDMTAYKERLELGDDAYFEKHDYPKLMAHFDNKKPKPLTAEQAYQNDWIEVMSDGFCIQCTNDLTAQN